MIRNLKIKNFKPLKDNEFKFRNLNLLTGINGMGKSSLVQSLLLLRQSFLKKESLLELHLENDLCKLGNEKDVLTRSSSDDFILFHLKTDEGNIMLKSNIAKKGSSTVLKTVLEVDNAMFIPDNLAEWSLFSNHFQYIGAERISPQSNHLIDEYIVREKRQISKEQGRCEYAIDFLATYAKEPVMKTLLHPNEPENNELLNQVDAWMSEISPDVKILPKKEGKKLELKIKYSNEEYEPINVGFGISYSLPIIIALLSAKVGDLIIIENPESHLHPKGQSKLAELICLAAQSGVQIFCETHSDHIINGTLVNIYEYYKDKRDNKEELKGINYENVNISFFRRKENEYISEVVVIPVSETGRIKNPPKAFFDQFNVDLKRLLK